MARSGDRDAKSNNRKNGSKGTREIQKRATGITDPKHRKNIERQQTEYIIRGGHASI